MALYNYMVSGVNGSCKEVNGYIVWVDLGWYWGSGGKGIPLFDNLIFNFINIELIPFGVYTISCIRAKAIEAFIARSRHKHT